MVQLKLEERKRGEERKRCFNSCMVQLKYHSPPPTYLKPCSFNSCMVQLKFASIQAKLESTALF